MAISDTQKVDWLWKKLGYGITKTDQNSIKNATNESIPSPLLLRADKVWNQSATIPTVIPSTSAGAVTVYSNTSDQSAIECDEDLTATARRTWKTDLTDWVPPEFGSTYLVKVFVDNPGAGDPQSTGTQLFAAGSGNEDQWFFDYQSGTLNFIGSNLPSTVTTGKAIYITGARYTGDFGVGGAGSGGGVTYTAGNGIVISNANVISIDSTTPLLLDTIIANNIVSLGNINASRNITGNALIVTTTGTFGGRVEANGAAFINDVTIQGNGNLSVSTGTLDIGGETTLRSNVNVLGNLIVTGNTVTNDVATVATDDLVIIVANNAPGLPQTDGAGISVFLANANIKYNQSNDRWESTRGFGIEGGVIPLTSDVYNLGSSTERFADLYITGNIYTTNGVIQSSGNITSITNDNVVLTANTGDLDFASTTGNVSLLADGQGGIFITSNTNTTITSDESTFIESIGGATEITGNTSANLTATSGDINLISETGNVNILAQSGNVYFGTNAALANVGLVVDNTTHWGNLDVQGRFTVNGAAVTASGVSGTIGDPSDADYDDGAYIGFSNTTPVADAIDILNEVIRNVQQNTYVRSVTFTGTPTTGGAGTVVTLTVTPTGNANRYDVDWGDGSGNTTGSTSTTITHTYATNQNSPFSVTVRAYNNAGVGSGSEASFFREDYITIATADPAVSFGIFSASTGGSALTNNNRYVIEGGVIYLENTTTNTSGANVTYNIAWGDSNTTTVTSDTEDGGVSGARASHTYGTGSSSGNGMLTINLSLTSHSTSNQNILPVSATQTFKVYDPAVAAPANLSTKSITFASATTGTSPKLVSGFTDSAGAQSTLSAGSSVSRVVANIGDFQSSETSSYAYDANVGVVSAIVDNAYDGNITLSTGDNTGTSSSIEITSESDYNLLGSSGGNIAFQSSIYYPGLYKGFRARVNKDSAEIAQGLHAFRIEHNISGTIASTANISFVKDDLTVAPTIASAGTISESGTVNLRYISGIPYYTSGTQLILSGVTISNFTGQTYTDAANPFFVRPGANDENTTSDAVSTTLSYTFAQIDGASTMLSGGIPIANVGRATSYAIANLTVPVTSSQVRTVQTIGVRADNVNGSGTQSNVATKLQVHTSAQSGISETSISVSSALGNGTFTDNAKRSFAFASDTTNTPSYNSSTNFYTASLYTESGDPGVQGTREASIRLGVIKHDVTNYSSGYLPVGPDRSGDTGTQYITIAFRRQVVANFTINITAPNGVAGVWIAAPGTSIDSTSSINGWLDCGAAYAGSGVPGSNTGSGGNGSNGCASTTGDRIIPSTALSGSYTMTLGSENLTNATNNVCLVRIAISSGQTVTALSIS